MSQIIQCIVPSTNYLSMMWYRRVVLIISCCALIWNIIIILAKKQYVFMTLKLLLFVEIFYLIALVIVLPHGDYITSGCSQIQIKKNQLELVLNNIITSMTPTQKLLCSSQAFINLTAYNISYFFGILITLNVRKVLDGTYKNFMRQNITMIISVISLILVVYFIPFGFAYTDNIWYSYGPSGFYLFTDWINIGEPNNFMIYYCGLSLREQSVGGEIVMNLQMFLIPAIMFVSHGYLLWINRKSIQKLQQLQIINPKNWFIIQTGYISSILFCVQLLNFIKQIITSINQPSGVLQIISIFFNIIFDLLPLTVVLIYRLKYFKKAHFYNRDNKKKNNIESLVTSQVEEYPSKII